MADSYSKWVMTTAFANNSQAALNSGGKIEWVSLKTSDDAHQVADLDGFNDTTLATANIKQISGISSVTISGNTVTITGLFNSTNNASDYYIRTIFLVAKYNGKEFLAGTTVANTSGSAFRMPASSDTEITEFTARPQISVTNTNSISTTVDPVASATNERVDSLEATLQGEIDDINVDKQNLWNKLADYVTKAAAETITGVKTFSQTIVGSITGNAGTATKLQTERTIGFSGDVNGTAQGFDGSKNITLPINLNSINQNNTTSTQSAGYNSPVTIIDGITRDTKGRVTGVNTKTVTLPPVQTTISGNAASATKLETARLIGGVSFDGTSDIILPGVNSIGNQNTTGNAATATNANLATKAVALQTPRKINGTNFDGTTDINVNAANDSNLVHRSGDENIAGVKSFSDETTFNKLINGALKTRLANFTNFSTVTTNMLQYAGLWYVLGGTITGAPYSGSVFAIIEVIPGNTNTNGIIKFTTFNNGAFFDGLTYVAIVTSAGMGPWIRPTDDSKVLHLTGTETVPGDKTFTGTNTFNKKIIAPAGVQGPVDLSQINVGGRNYILNSKRSLSGSSNVNDTGWVDTSIPISTLSNMVFTVSVQVDYDNVISLSGSKRLGIELIAIEVKSDGTNVTRFFGVWRNPTVGESFHGRISATFDMRGVTLKSIYTPNHWGQGLYIQGITATNVSVSNPKIEIGNIATDWTPAPEDVPSNDAQLVHNLGTETVAGDKTFTGNNTFTKNISGNITGNSGTATKLQTPRNINGIGFDGTSDITVDPVVKFIGTDTDLFTLSNGFYYFNGVVATNKPAAASNYFVVEVIQTDTNGSMRLIDNNGLSFWTTKSASAWGAWHQDADGSTVVHNSGDETINGSKNFTSAINTNAIEISSGIPFIDFHFARDASDYTSRIYEAAKGVLNVNGVEFSKGQLSVPNTVSKNVVKKTITTSAPISLNFAETAFGVMVYASASGQFTVDSTWKTLATLPTEISAPVQVVTLNDVGWAGVGGVTNRFGVGLKIAIKPNREITYRVTSLKENDNTTYNIVTDFDLSTYWSK